MKHIFVVDDSITTLKLAERALKQDYELTLLTSGRQLFAALEKKQPDLILLDIEMPDMDGMFAIDKLKNLPHLAHIPVIFLTSHSEKRMVMSGFESGAIDYIVKPFDSVSLCKRIDSHLMR